MNIFFFTQYILMFDCLEIYRSAIVVKSARAFGQIRLHMNVRMQCLFILAVSGSNVVADRCIISGCGHSSVLH